MQTSMGAAGELRVAGDAEIGATEELRKVLLQWLAQQQSAAIDLAEVGSCDAATVQLLVSLRKTAACMHKELVVKDASRQVREAFAALGIPLELAGDPHEGAASSNGEHGAQ